MRQIRNIRTGVTYSYDGDDGLQRNGLPYKHMEDGNDLYRTLHRYGSYENFFWPGNYVSDSVLLDLFGRNYIVGLGVVDLEDTVSALRKAIVQDGNGVWVFPAPVTADTFKDVDQTKIELYPDWAERINSDLGAVPYEKFVAAQNKLPDNENADPEELYSILKYVLSDMDHEGYPPVEQDDLDDAEDVWYAHQWMASKWLDAMGPMARFHGVEVTETPYGLALLVVSEDGKRLLRVPFEDIAKRDQKDLGRIILWLDSPLGYDNAIDYEEGDTHILIWPEPYECEDARHVPDGLLPWGVEA